MDCASITYLHRESRYLLRASRLKIERSCSKGQLLRQTAASACGSNTDTLHASCCVLALLIFIASTTQIFSAEKLSPHVEWTPGPVNSVAITSDNGDRIAVYGATETDKNPCQRVLLTHHRRDVVWNAQQAIANGAKVIAPEAERDWIEKPEAFWSSFTKMRFHDYSCQTTKILALPIKVDQWVKEGNTVESNGLRFEVIDTPGYTKGSVSYLASVDGKRIAFTGDLIYGDGQLMDLYSLQDAIPEADIRGYHGYAGRLGPLVASLRKIAELKPDMLIPAHGPIIRDPQPAIAKLVDRVQSIYRNYLSTNALHWYFKEERMKKCGARVLGKDTSVELMPYSIHQKAPDWIFEHATSRLLISEDGHGFLLDCGYQRVIDAIQKLIDTGVIKKVDGIFVTHYHDDHTDKVQAAAELFKCPVYAMEEYKDILANPSAYHMPAMTSEPIKDINSFKDGHTMTWKDLEFTFHFFPGQTYYHGALLAKRAKERPVFFIGDSFAPSGIDDYCLLNRNLLHANEGYQLCFSKCKSIAEPFWIVNEHISYVFQFDQDEWKYLEDRYRQRNEVLKDLFPWDDPNYGIDEQWAVLKPYGSQVSKQEEIELQLHITNHSPVERTFEVSVNLPESMKLISNGDLSQSIASAAKGVFKFKVNVGDKTGNFVPTANVRSQGMEFRHWVEALVSVD